MKPKPGTAFLREKVREGSRAAARSFGVKLSEDEGVAHGATPPDEVPGYHQQYLNDSIDRAFDASKEYYADPSDMPQPGVLHGALNYWNRGTVLSPQAVQHPLIVKP